jgi:hypothetical protein
MGASEKCVRGVPERGHWAKLAAERRQKQTLALLWKSDTHAEDFGGHHRPSQALGVNRMPKSIPLHQWQIRLSRSHSRRPPKVFSVDVMEALVWASKNHGRRLGALSSAFDQYRSSSAYRSWVKGRPSIRSLPAFNFYRRSINSRALNAEVHRSIGPYSRPIEELIAEIRHQGFDLTVGQLVFTGKAFKTPPYGHVAVRSFLSTSINPAVAAAHARDHAHWANARAYVFVIRLTHSAKALWGQFRAYREYELLFPPGAHLVVQAVHVVRNGLYDVVTADLV